MRKTIFLLLTLFLFAKFADAQRPRKCVSAGAGVKAEIFIESNGDINIKPCPTRQAKVNGAPIATGSSGGSGSFTGAATSNSNSVTLAGDGTSGTPLTATVKRSTDANNALELRGNGLYVPSGGGGGPGEVKRHKDIQEYSSILTDALTSIGTAKKLLTISTAITCAAPVTIPANVTLEFSNDGKITKTGTCTIIFEGYGLLDPTNPEPVFANFGVGEVKWATGATKYPREIAVDLFGGASWSENVNRASKALEGKRVTLKSKDGTITSQVEVKEFHLLEVTGTVHNTLNIEPQVLLESNTEINCRNQGTLYSSNQPGKVQFIYAKPAAVYPFDGLSRNINIKDCKIRGYDNLGLPLDTADSAVFLGNVDGFELTGNWVDNVQGFGLYVGAFPTAGHTARNGIIANNRFSRVGAQNLGCIQCSNVKIINNFIHKVGQIIRENNDAVTTNGSTTVTTPTGQFAPHHNATLVELIRPDGTSFFATVTAVNSTTSLTLSVAPTWTSTTTRLRILSPFLAAIDIEPNSPEEAADFIEIDGNKIDFSDAVSPYSNGIVVQAGGGSYVRNVRISNNHIIGGNDSPNTVYRKLSNGITLYGAVNSTVENNVIRMAGQSGIYVGNSRSLTVRNNIMSTVGGGGTDGFRVDSVSDSDIEGNIINNTATPISQSDTILETESSIQVNVSGTTVTRITPQSGILFYYFWYGKTVNIAGTDYTVASVNPNTVQLTLTTSAGTQNNVTLQTRFSNNNYTRNKASNITLAPTGTSKILSLYDLNPQGVWTIPIAGNLSPTRTLVEYQFDTPVKITKINTRTRVAPVGCSTNAVVRLSHYNGVSTVNRDVTITADNNAATNLNFNINPSFAVTATLHTAAAGCTTMPSDTSVFVTYVSR